MAKPSLKERLKAHFAEYGTIALYTYIALSILTIAGFSIAIGAGIEPSSASGVLGVIGAAWLAAKATMPIRILITLGITPVIATIVNKRKAKKAAKSEDASSESGKSESAKSESAKSERAKSESDDAAKGENPGAAPLEH